MDDENSVVINFDANVSDAEKKVKQLEDAVDKALKERGGDAAINKELDEALDTISQIEKALGGVRTQPITNAKWMGYDKEVLKAIDEQYGELGESAEAGAQKVNSLKAAIDSVKDELKKQEDEGEWFGDVKYDEAYRTLVELNAEAKAYVAELSKTPEMLEREAAAAQKAAEREAAAAQKAEERAAKEAAIAEAQAQKEAAIVAEETRLQQIKNEAEVSDQAIVYLNERLVELKRRQSELELAGVGIGYAEYDEIVAELARANAELAEYRNGLTDAGDKTKDVANNTKKVSPAMEAATTATDKFMKRLKSLVNRVFVFSLITTGLRSIREWMGKVIDTNAETSAAVAKLKGALLTLVQPLVEYVLPVFTRAVNIITSMVNKLAALVSKLFGTTVEASAAAAEQLYNETEALDATADAAKKASKTLAGFDEVNRLSSPDTEEESSTSSSVDFSGVVLGETDRIVEALVGAALLAVGAILTFTGISVLQGITLMALGALAIYDVYSEDPDAFKEMLDGISNEGELLTGIVLVLIGLILVASGIQLLLGITLIALGALAIYDVYSEDPDAIGEFLESSTGALALLIVGVVLVILGIILVCAGVSIPLGIALIAAGATALVTEAVLNWDKIEEDLQGPIGDITAIASGALLALGIILVCTGVGIPLGVALIAAGAAGLVMVAVLNWDKIVEDLQGPIGAITAIVSAALLVLGIILICTGVGIPLGIALIIAGAAGLVTVTAINWDGIVDKLKGVWETIKTWWNTYVAKFFTAKYWKDLAINMINGFIDKIESGLNSVLSGAGGFVNSIIGVLNKIPGVDIGEVNWGNISLPRLAQGAVIPPNREFMAVLGDQKHGTNIEAPLETIQEAVALVMDDFIDSNIAGHEATVAVLREILSAVLGISIGDDVIADAVSRANTRKSIMRGSTV